MTLHTPTSKLKLNHALHYPQAYANLLSINQFCLKNRCFFILIGTHNFVKDNHMGQTLLEGGSNGGLYPINLQSSILNKPLAMAAVVGVKASVLVWNSRLAHASNSVVTHLLSKHSLPYFGSLNKSEVCELCQLGKGKQLPFLNSN